MEHVAALVLARGRGRRMRAGAAPSGLTEAQAAAARAGWKALMPVGGRPFLDFVLSSLADAGCEDVAVVIGPEQRTAFEAAIRRGRTRRTRVSLIEQAEARGTADAVLAAEPWVAGRPFVTVNGDNLYPSRALRDLAGIESPGLAVFDAADLLATSNIPAERIAEFALVQLTPAGTLARIVEKPAGAGSSEPGNAGVRTPEPRNLGAPEPQSLVSMNAWRFDARMFAVCREVPRSGRGEYELPEAVQLAVEGGMHFRAVRAAGPVLDLSRPLDVAGVAARLAGVEPRP